MAAWAIECACGFRARGHPLREVAEAIKAHWETDEHAVLMQTQRLFGA